MPFRRDTVVIGASLGGISALKRLLGALPADLEAAVMIVLHQSRDAGHLDEVLRIASTLPLDFVREPCKLVDGRVYLAPPDQHLIVTGDEALVTRGPREMRARPAINPLFRTAAAARGGRVIAIQLSGLLDDGVAGLEAVKRCGGLALVQDPAEAEYPDMPQSAIDAVDVDHIAPLTRLAALLSTLVRETAQMVEIPEDIAIEARLSGLEPCRPVTVERIGEQVPVACPDCGGPLWQLGKSRTAMFRCHVGHALSGQALLSAQNEEIERSLWVAVRSLSERAATLNKLADNVGKNGARLTEKFRERADEAMSHSENARRFLLSLQSESATPQGDSPSPRRDSSAVHRASLADSSRPASRDQSSVG